MKKRILKRMGYSLLILSALMLKTACFNLSSAQNVLFYKSTEHVGMGYVSIYDSPVLFDFENEKYRFESDSQGILHLKSANGVTDYLSFTSYREKNTEDLLYFVKKIYTNNPNLQFLEISACKDEDFKTIGYWLIGKYNNKWVTYVSFDSLKSIGLSDLTQVTSEVNRNGKMILDINEDYPDHVQIELYWNDTSNRIEMRKYKV